MVHQEANLQSRNKEIQNKDNITATQSTYQTIKVEVVYAAVDRQKIYPNDVAVGSSIAAVIIKSGVLEDFPEINLAIQKVGVFSKPRSLQDIVVEGDRIEIYRPLLADPKERRRSNVNASDKKKAREKQMNNLKGMNKVKDNESFKS